MKKRKNNRKKNLLKLIKKFYFKIQINSEIEQKITN